MNSILTNTAFFAATLDIPDQLKKNINLGVLIIMAVAAVYCVIKCISGADMLDRGEDGKKKIYSGIAIGMAPWIIQAALKVTKIWDKLGLDMGASGASMALPAEVRDAIQLGLWVIIGIAVIWAIGKCVQGAEALEKGEEGKQKIFSGIAIAFAPWIAVAAMNLSGYWDALGLTLI